MEEVIKVSNLTRKYKDFSLGPVDLSFPKGFATALIGANGAGKTTLMDIICGITAKTDGTVTYFGETDNADKGNVKERMQRPIPSNELCSQGFGVDNRMIELEGEGYCTFHEPCVR